MAQCNIWNNNHIHNRTPINVNSHCITYRFFLFQERTVYPFECEYYLNLSEEFCSLSFPTITLKIIFFFLYSQSKIQCFVWGMESAIKMITTNCIYRIFWVFEDEWTVLKIYKIYFALHCMYRKMQEPQWESWYYLLI